MPIDTLQRKRHVFDALLLLHDAGGPVTTSSIGNVAGGSRVLDLGDANVSGFVVVDVTALDQTDGNETYSLAIQGCASVGFASGVVDLGRVSINGIGRSEAGFTTRQDMTTYRYVRASLTLAGTTPSITCTAFIAKA